MRYRFYTCDVFTGTRFGGNQLAVLPEAQGLTGDQMQQIAREFNYSETSFVLPPERGRTRKVRIFTTTTELPFAGHPNIGTAFVLAVTGALGTLGPRVEVVFEEEAGLVPIAVHGRPGGRVWCELEAPQRLFLGPTVPTSLVASALSLDLAEIIASHHPPQIASVGFPFLFAELADGDALRRARPDLLGFEGLVAAGVETAYVHLYIRDADGFDIRARMFAPLDSPPEDPATGSANCALVALLSHLDPAADGDFQWRIGQGVEMGRPSILEARTRKKDGEVVGVWIGGDCVLVSDGWIEVS